MKNIKFSIRLLVLVFCMTAFLPACNNLDEELFSAVTQDNFFKTEDELISLISSILADSRSWLI